MHSKPPKGDFKDVAHPNNVSQCLKYNHEHNLSFICY